MGTQNVWNLSPEESINSLRTALTGLSREEIIKRQKEDGLNLIHKRSVNAFDILLRQFKGNALIIILLIATVISYILGQHISSYYIFGITLASILLGFWNEYSSEKTVSDLLKKITSNAVVLRNNEKYEVPVTQITIGDIVLLSPGTIIPAELRLLEVNALQIDQSALTGESKPSYKQVEKLTKENLALDDITNVAFMGTVVLSGSGKGVVYAIGKHTNYGKISEEVLYTKPETQFQLALTKFGNLLVRTILLLTCGIFLVNALLGHSLLESVLFALAIAVGLTPELLPVIVTVSLSHGAGKLAKKEVVVKQLIAIENLGNMDVLCTDKTGTLTEGKIQLVNYFDESEKKDEMLLKYALLCNNAVVHHKILGDAIDVAIWEYAEKEKYHLDKTIKKIDEEPFDFSRRATYCVIEEKGKALLIVRGAPEEIIALCSHSNKKELLEKFTKLSNDGYRITAIAIKPIEEKKEYAWTDVTNVTFAGFMVFLDIPKKTAKEALEKLKRLSVQVKVITGDNEIITRKICGDVGLNIEKILLGNDIEKFSDDELKKAVNNTDVFAKTSPMQKNRIVLALKANGHTVGYMGDGINDVLSLHSSDVGISVSSAVDVAKDTASIVLLRKSLDVVADGIQEGRMIFNNTIKYILMSTSSNFGNMFSAAGASFFLPFLPMTAIQILLVNGLYDISQMTIPSDNVDPESLVKPRHWNIHFIKDYMLFFGPISSLYDFATFGVMLFIFHARGALFQTGWFIESIATEILVVFVIRTAKVPFFKSKPGKWLLITCVTVVTIGILLPYSPLAPSLGLVPPPLLYFGILLILITAYIVMVEFCKKIFLRKYSL